MGEVIRRGEWPHRHDMPDWGQMPPGTIWRCNCGQVFERMTNEWKLSNYVPPLPPPEPKKKWWRR